MRKLIVLAVMAAAFAALMAPSASATVHPLVCSENSSASADGTPADTQNPPGITDGTDPDPDNNEQARPVVAINSNSTTNDSENAFKPEGC